MFQKMKEFPYSLHWWILHGDCVRRKTNTLDKNLHQTIAGNIPVSRGHLITTQKQMLAIQCYLECLKIEGCQNVFHDMVITLLTKQQGFQNQDKCQN